MARRHGRNGVLYVGSGTSSAASPVAFLKDWSIEFTVDQQDVTSFLDTNKVYVTGLPDVKGSFSGFWDDATAQTYVAATDGQSRRFYLYPDITNAPGVNWNGTAFFDFSAAGAVDAAVTINGSFVAAGAVVKSG